MKKLLLGVVLLGLLGCGEGKETTGVRHTIGGNSLWEVCLNGVLWYKASGVLEKAIGRDSKVILCEEKTYE